MPQAQHGLLGVPGVRAYGRTANKNTNDMGVCCRYVGVPNGLSTHVLSPKNIL